MLLLNMSLLSQNALAFTCERAPKATDRLVRAMFDSHASNHR
jgi:hypothetical protein